MDEEHKDRLRRWKRKAEDVHHDHWIRFVIHWMILDAYMTEESGADSDGEKIRWFINSDNELKLICRSYWLKPEYVRVLETLQNHSPLTDMRPRHRHEATVPFSNINNEDELIRFMYQIRCNTFHGGKDLFDKDDNELTRCVEFLLEAPLGEYLSNE